jgi:uncharacterized protein YndB with AHSA1/START domain
MDQKTDAGPLAARTAVHGDFTLERRLEAPVEQVWAALTTLDAKAKWFGGPPEQWTPIERVMDVREGGRECAKGRWASGLVTTFEALYLDVAPLSRLVYSYVMTLDETRISVSLATVQLTREGAGTRLKLVEQGAFLDGYDDAGARERGTADMLGKLAASLSA